MMNKQKGWNVKNATSGKKTNVGRLMRKVFHLVRL